jgi:hypothetical protein
MSLDPIEPIRVVPTRPADPLKRERRPGEEGGRRRPREEPQDRREEAEEDDGLPHIDVRA